jgi:hypothetical protein
MVGFLVKSGTLSSHYGVLLEVAALLYDLQLKELCLIYLSQLYSGPLSTEVFGLQEDHGN